MRVASVSVLLALLVAGCAAAPSTSPVPSTGPALPSATPSPTTGPPLIRVTFDISIPNGPSRMELVTDGVRSRIRYPGDEAAGQHELANYNASDGFTHVVCGAGECRRDAAEPAQLPGTPAFEQLCPSGKQTGSGELLGRPTTSWACQGLGLKPVELTLDGEFPFLQLAARSDGGYWESKATAVEVGVAVPADYFSVDRPGLAFPPVKPGRVVPPKPGKDGAVLPRLGGGEMRMTDYTDGPAVIVIGEESQLRPALARMRRVAAGALPTLVGVLQLRDDGSGARPPSVAPFDVPVALNTDEGKTWQDMTGGRGWPVAVFCEAARAGCTAIGVWELSDAELAARLAA